MKEQDIKVDLRIDFKTKSKLNLIAQDKGIKRSVLIRRIVQDYIRLYEERGY